VGQFEGIRRDRREEGLSIRALARRHQVHRRAVRQALASATPPAKRVRPWTAPAIGRHLATIRRWLIEDRSAPRKQRHTARRIWERLVDEEDAEVSEPTVRRTVARLRRELDLERRDVAIVALHVPGEEAQVDFGKADAIIAGVRTRISLFHLRLSHSGQSVTVAYPTEGQEAFFEGHVLAFSRLGGVPGRIRYDNPRVGEEVVEESHASDAARDRQTHAAPGRCRGPEAARARSPAQLRGGSRPDRHAAARVHP
jgi:transposase